MIQPSSSEKKKFLFLTSNPVWGGSEELWSRTAFYLATEGHSVTVFVGKEIDLDTPILKSLAIAGGMIRRLVTPDWWPKKIATACHLYWPLTNWLMTANVASAFRHEHPDLVVISQGLNHDGWFLSSVCREHDAPYVLVSQKADDMYWPDDDFCARIRCAHQGAVATFFVSQHNRRITEEQLGVRLVNARVVQNPFNADWNAKLSWPDGDMLWLACPARLDAREKGQDLIMRVLSQEKWKQRPLGVRFFGKGPNERGLARMAQFLGIRNVDFAGFTNKPGEIWRSHHGLVLPSRCEGLPLTVVEAMLSHRVSVVCDTGGTAEVVADGENGFVATSATKEALDATLELAWERRSCWRDLGIAAGRSIRKLVPPDPPKAFGEELILLAETCRQKGETTRLGKSSGVG